VDAVRKKVRGPSDEFGDEMNDERQRKRQNQVSCHGDFILDLGLAKNARSREVASTGGIDSLRNRAVRGLPGILIEIAIALGGFLFRLLTVHESGQAGARTAESARTHSPPRTGGRGRPLSEREAHGEDGDSREIAPPRWVHGEGRGWLEKVNCGLCPPLSGRKSIGVLRRVLALKAVSVKHRRPIKSIGYLFAQQDDYMVEFMTKSVETSRGIVPGGICG
jgi:hypothetical protein